MSLTTLILGAANLLAVLLLAFAVYFRRHRRRDLVVAFIGVNIGVFAVASILSSVSVAMGVGLGLFGVLSIIRLRSSEINQREVAYYFAALAMGLIAGLAGALEITNPALPLGLLGLILITMWIADHPALLPRNLHQQIRVDRAVANETELKRQLEQRLGVTVTGVTVQQLDFVNDSTLVDVRYRPLANRKTSAAGRSKAPVTELSAAAPFSNELRNRPAPATAGVAAQHSRASEYV